jgi:hypothetical protein
MRWLLPLLAIAALIPAGCGSSSAAPNSSDTSTTAASPPPASEPASTSSKPSRVYTKKDLARLVLQPKDSPADMRYVKGASGPMTLEQIGLILPRQVKELRSYGFRAVRDAVFAAKSPASDRSVAERVWLMKNGKSASRWLGKSKDDSVGLGFSQLQPAAIGDESWAATGQANGGVIITHSFRLGNAVFVVSMYSAKGALSPAAARAAEIAALTRARSA